MTRKLYLLVAWLIVLAALLQALSQPDPSWDPSTAFTNDTLTCSWSLSGDVTHQNITILNGTIIYNSTFENASEQALSTQSSVTPGATVKGQQWWCRIEVFNETDSSMENKSITIKNSPPTTEGEGAGIFNDSGDDIGFLVQIEEDTTLDIDVNATDADNDVLTYLPADEFCTRTSSTTGTYECSPTQDDLDNNTATQTNITFTASDGQNVGGRTVTFNVTPVNDPPNATLADQESPVNQSLNYTFTVSDEESDFPLTHALIFNSSNSEIQDKMSVTTLNGDGTSVSIFYDASSPDFDDVGYWPIFLNMTDSKNASNVSSYFFNITAVGRKPYFTNVTPSGPYNVSQGEFIQINVSANDDDANTTITFLDDTTNFDITTVINNNSGQDALGQINYTPANDHVGQFNVTITIQDEESLTNTTVLQFNVTNVNDPPTVNEISASPANTQDNQNASDLTAWANAPFVYDVNATDPDTIHGDTLNYTDNTTLFTINLTTGRINFTPADGDVGLHHVNVTVLDDDGTEASRTLVLDIQANAPPYFNATLPLLSCIAEQQCTLGLSGFVNDSDVGDNVSLFEIDFIGSALDSFSHNETSGLIDFTPLKSEVGNYTINVTIHDEFGATNASTMDVEINNTPEAPNLTRFNFSGETIVENHLFSYTLRATDDDFSVPTISENVTFTTNLSINHTISATTVSNTTASAILSFTPPDGSAGNYTIWINATDSFGLNDTKVITFEILEDVPPPNITQVTPWGQSPGFTIQTTYRNTSDLGGDSVDVVVPENTTVFFDLIVNSSRPLTYNWTLNGSTIPGTSGSTTNHTRYFNFSSAGQYIFTVNISNDRLEHSLWTWDMTVTDVNRPPRLENPLETPIEVNTTSSFSDFFTFRESETKFFDPDDDTNNNSVIDGNETNTLTFSVISSCSVASLSVDDDDLVVTPQEIGTCNALFNATDAGGLTAQSGIVLINVTDVPEEETTTTTTSSGGGGGGGGSSSIVIPLNNQQEPEAFNLIAPKLITIYGNRTVEIPIVVNNTWREDLEDVHIWAESNASTVDLSLSESHFGNISVNSSEEVTLFVRNYRLGENYEVIVHANVSDPEYEDSALVLLNSIEQARAGDQVAVKVTFANDLLNQHSECQELNEILDEARQELRGGNVVEAGRLVDGVISGCKYLVGTQQRIDERPARISPVINLGDISTRTIMWSVLVFVLLVSIALIAYYHYSYHPDEDF